MARPAKYTANSLSQGDIEKIKKLISSRIESNQRVRRAKILLLSYEGQNNIAIAEKLDINRNSVELCLKKYNEAGLEAALLDSSGRGRKPVITDEEKTYIINIACQSPYDLGYAQELWTQRLLKQHIQKQCEKAGYPGLITIVESTIGSILKAAEIKPHKIRYYLERRDPDFDHKMNEVLIVYKQLEMDFTEGREPKDVVIS